MSIHCELECDLCHKLLRHVPWLAFSAPGFVYAEAKRSGWVRKKTLFGIKVDVCDKCRIAEEIKEKKGKERNA